MSADSCFVCDGRLAPAFSKQFAWLDMGLVAYERCASCGLVVSRTHASLNRGEWERLNTAFHRERDPDAGRSTDQRWLDRARGYVAAIGAAMDLGAIPKDRSWLDYGCGKGHLADLVEERTGHEILRYEPFLPGEGDRWVDAAALDPHTCDLVINTAMFEHVLDRASLDRLAGLVSAEGVLALHTVVVERVPDDPGWFYLLPVHCAFFTNAAMDHLCRDWGFRASAYHVPSRLWLLFRRPLSALPDELSRDPWVSAEGFAGYWK